MSPKPTHSEVIKILGKMSPGTGVYLIAVRAGEMPDWAVDQLIGKLSEHGIHSTVIMCKDPQTDIAVAEIQYVAPGLETRIDSLEQAVEQQFEPVLWICQSCGTPQTAPRVLWPVFRFSAVCAICSNMQDYSGYLKQFNPKD